MEFSPQQKTKSLEEVIKADIEKKADFAMQHPIKNELFDYLRSEALEIYSKEDPTEEDRLRLAEIDTWFRNATIFVPDLYQFKVLLETLGCDQEYINDILDHENAHGNRTTQLKAYHYGYTIIVTVDEETGEYILNPQSPKHIPEEWSEWRKNRVEIAISKAPQDYGNTLSERDEADLERLYEERKQLRLKKK